MWERGQAAKGAVPLTSDCAVRPAARLVEAQKQRQRHRKQKKLSREHCLELSYAGRRFDRNRPTFLVDCASAAGCREWQAAISSAGESYFCCCFLV